MPADSESHSASDITVSADTATPHILSESPLLFVSPEALIGQMIKERRFERYIVLSGTGKAGQIAGIYDERGGQLC